MSNVAGHCRQQTRRQPFGFAGGTPLHKVAVGVVAVPFVRVYPGLELHYFEVGEGPPLICIDGVGASWVWYRNVAPLSRHLRVILLDTLGTGDSDKPLGPYPVELIARQLAEVITELDLGRSHLMGLSQGGLAAMELALRWPELADRLVLVGASPGGRLALPPSPLWPVLHDPLPFLPQPANFLRSISGALSPEFIKKNPEEMLRIATLAAAKQTPITSRIAINLGAFLWRGLEGRCLEHPVLALAGSRDELALTANTVRLAAVLPNATCYLFPGSGHLCQIEQPDRFNQLVLTFLLGAC